MDERHPRADRSTLVLPLLIALLVTTLGLGASVAAGMTLDRTQRRAAEQAMDRRMDLVSQAVSTEAGRYVDALRMLAAAMGAFEQPTDARFGRVVAPLRDMRLAGATSIAFLVPATDEQIPRVQARWRERGLPDLVLRPAGADRDHIFSVFSRSLDGRRVPAVGIDFTEVEASVHAFAEARRSGRVAVSDTYHLLRDRDLPVQRRQLSFVLTAPVHGPPDARGRRPFVGWVRLGLRGQDFIGATLRHITQGAADVRLLAHHGASPPVTVATLTAEAAGRRDLRRSRRIPVAQRSWVLELRAPRALLPGADSPLPAVALSAGAVVSLLLGALTFTMVSGRARAQAQVVAATAELHAELDRGTAREEELRAARDELASHDAYLIQILDAIDVPVITCDTDGVVVHANRAAREALPDTGGRPLTIAEDLAEPALAYPDGTPIPARETPLAVALHGENVDDMEVVVTPPDRPRSVIMVHARPLRRSDGRVTGAVTSAFTITALREREAELRAFAGIVAHDLKRPLTAVRGFAELVHEDLSARGGHEEHVAQLDRVLAATDRMRRLIDDLLAYAAARDATVTPVRIDLTALVRELLEEHLAVAAPEPVPRVEVGDLPPVRADAALVRQLLDNLIGNALKYAPPGRPAHVEITGRHCSGGRVCVQVADRGIGIPAGEHEAIFTGFHRAATTYSGTGLGLAICKRVVERHGGTILAEDNPGGGARFRFTLPAADDASPPSGAA